MKRIITITTVLILAIIATSETQFSTGIAGRTGAPAETTCDNSGCHADYTLNSGPGSIVITSSDLTNWSYVPGQTYHITVTVSQTGQPLFGFDFEALKTRDTTNAGSLASGGSDDQIMSKTVSGKVRYTATHTSAGGLTNDTHSFNFTWTAPSADSGYVKFWAAGVAADNSGDPTGDYVYTTTQIVSSPSTVGIHDLVASGSFSIYPNPVRSDCSISFGSGVKEGKCDIQLYNLAGSLVQSAVNQSILSNRIADFKIADNISTGIYMMRINVNGNVSTKKIIVNKN